MARLEVQAIPQRDFPGPFLSVPANQVSDAVDGCPCLLVVDTGVAKTFVREEVVAAQHLPVLETQLCGVTGHCMMLCLPMMSKIASVACVDLGRMDMKLCGETIPLILEDAAGQMESAVAGSDVEDE
ncbi:hypothetical protein E2C01_057824 [Portunus trituberculatus]|uniref:Uncharacterized protein n=1 Tax=Portunus trituberculatus TaxID=210409 RepID=A0A5B7GY14_PORTR|nr:hypothetical protein [Portunus trituberculatus]